MGLVGLAFLGLVAYFFSFHHLPPLSSAPVNPECDPRDLDDEYRQAYQLMEQPSEDAAKAFEDLAACFPYDRMVVLHNARLTKGDSGETIRKTGQNTVFVLGIPQHIIQCGHNREPCFYAEDDYRSYLGDSQEAAIRNQTHIHAYVLMTNHVHLLATLKVLLAFST